MRYQFLFILIFCFILTNKAQTIRITGKTIESQTNKILSFVNISVEGTSLGTVSNLEGNFILNVPLHLKHKKILFSHIGYKIGEYPIKSEKKVVVALEKREIEIGEVIIMPDSSLKLLLKKAYDRIKYNYINKATRSKGFYRETMQYSDSLFLYFGEAIIDVYKPSYKNKTKGHVAILKSRINKFPHSDTINTTKFYGGPYFPVTKDFVKNRKSFLDPANFKNYKYKIDGLTLYGDKRMAYIISFDNDNGNLSGSFKGRMIIDKKSLAYLSLEFSSTTRGLKKRTTKQSNLTCTKGSTIIIYSNYGDKYFLRYISDKEEFINNTTKHKFKEDNEYLTTSIDSINNEPIPYAKQYSFGE